MSPSRTKEVPVPEDRLPPQNLEAEIAVLGSMMISEDAIAAALEMLDEDCFYHDAHRKIFRAVISLFNKNRPVDMLILTDELKNEGVLEEIGGVSCLARLSAAMPTAANVEYYAGIVREKAVLRSLINVATRIVQEGFQAEGDVEAFLDKSERLIFGVTSGKVNAELIPIKELVKDSIEVIEGLCQKKTHVTGVATGFYDLDRMTAGLQPSDLVIVAGRPSMGKSALATSIAEHAGITQKVPVAMFSLEMSKEQLVQRMLCSRARLELHKVRGGFLSEDGDDWVHLTTAAGTLSEAPIFIDDSPSLSALEVRAKARRLKSRYHVGLIIVDYLQLMRGHSRAENRQQEISEISRSLKALARELNVPVIAVSQLSRAVEARSPQRPQLSDLRESGAIEQDADVVMLIYREKYYKPDIEENKAEVIIAKQRNGPVGTVDLMFLEKFVRFESMTQEPVAQG